MGDLLKTTISEVAGKLTGFSTESISMSTSPSSRENPAIERKNSELIAPSSSRQIEKVLPVSNDTSFGPNEAKIFIASVPPLAFVYFKNKLIGQTNVSEIKLPAGKQLLTFEKNGKKCSRYFDLMSGKNYSQLVRLDYSDCVQP